MNEEAPCRVSELSIGSTQYRYTFNRSRSIIGWNCVAQPVYREPDYMSPPVAAGDAGGLEYTAISTKRETDMRLMPFSYF